MKKIFVTREITAALFLVLLFGFSIMNFLYSENILIETVMNQFNDKEATMKEKVVAIEAAIDDNVIHKLEFIEFYGLLHKTLDKNEIGNFEVVKDTDDKLHYAYFADKPNEVDVIGDRMIALAEDAKASGARVLYVMPPDKVVEGVTEFALGLPQTYDNMTADNFLRHIEAGGVEYIDLRDTLAESGIDPNNYFYDTDHHWQIPTAFWAAGQIVEYMETEHGRVLDLNDYYMNLNNYNQILYENASIGSMGRDTGIIYAGVEDFTLVYPKFDTHYSLVTDRQTGELEEQIGEFENVLIQSAKFTDDNMLMEVADDKYFAYLGGNYPFQSINNLDSTYGLKILMIKDSFFVPVAAFLSPTCSKIDLLDPRFYKGSIEEVIAQGDYDYVMVAFSPPNLTTEFFDFHKEVEEK